MPKSKPSSDLDLTHTAPPLTAPAPTPPGASPPAHHAKTVDCPLPAKNPTRQGLHGAAASMAEVSCRRLHGTGLAPPPPTSANAPPSIASLQPPRLASSRSPPCAGDPHQEPRRRPPHLQGRPKDGPLRATGSVRGAANTHYLRRPGVAASAGAGSGNR
ncbi:hypothetical protein D1007_03509 [Hordeum vulgare]|nr:hypothetical protein D1007_03509 [Hordeum vulgare]